MTDDAIDLVPVLKHLHAGRPLDTDQARDVFEAMMSGSVGEAQIAAILTLMTTRVPEPDELVGAAKVMRHHVTAVPTSIDADRILDTCGTGGAPKTFNVSTAASIIAAAAGVPTAKHGNRSRTGRGSAELLEALGIDINASPDVQARCLDEAGICFSFAIRHHPATAHVAPVRRALGFPTIFNLLGPLTNPAGAGRQLMGVWDPRFAGVMAEALARLGSVRALVLHSHDGLDELSISAPTDVWHVDGGSVRQDTVDPEGVGLPVHDRQDVTARDLDHAVELVRGVLDGSQHGAPRDMVLFNAAGAMLAGGACDDLASGVALGASLVDSGRARETLERLAQTSRG